MAPRTVGNTDAGNRERFEFSFSPFPSAVAKFPSGQSGVTGSSQCWFGSQLRLGIAVGAVRALADPRYHLFGYCWRPQFHFLGYCWFLLMCTRSKGVNSPLAKGNLGRQGCKTSGRGVEHVRAIRVLAPPPQL